MTDLTVGHTSVWRKVEEDEFEILETCNLHFISSTGVKTKLAHAPANAPDTTVFIKEFNEVYVFKKLVHWLKETNETAFSSAAPKRGDAIPW